MANLEKHTKDPVQEWIADAESSVPTRSRSVRTLGAYIKIPKPLPRRARSYSAGPPEAKPEPALMREPARLPKPEAKHTQPSSREHLQKQDRLSNLRAPYRYK